jgi:hypothetical protein
MSLRDAEDLIVFDRQLSNFGVKIFELYLVIVNPPDLSGKHPGQPINGLSFPRRHLRRLSVFACKHLPVVDDPCA